MRIVTLQVEDETDEKLLLKAISSIPGVQVESENKAQIAWENLLLAEQQSLIEAENSIKTGRVRTWEEAKGDFQKLIG